MFNSVALNVVIGLVFIYLLYSLFATVLAEIFATKVGLRARNLKEAVNRMLNDEVDDRKTSAGDRRHPFRVFWSRLADSLMLFKNPENRIVDKFYDHPEIKYLGSSGIFRTPSSFKSVSFSKTLVILLNEWAQKRQEGEAESVDRTITKENIQKALESTEQTVLGAETREYVLSLWRESYGDILKFRLLLEGWFDRTMEQALEWYKRKIQLVLLVLGFFIAWFFNADTFTIVRRLSTDKDAREQMVQLAAAYLEKHPERPQAAFSGARGTQPGGVTGVADTGAGSSVPARDTAAGGAPVSSGGITASDQKALDELLDAKRELEKDMAEANSILGLGGWLPDSIYVTDSGRVKEYSFPVEADLLPDGKRKALDEQGAVTLTRGDKFGYFFGLAGRHFWGFLITAIAISLGAPFWFDLLNKLMKLRTAEKQATDTRVANSDAGVSLLRREG